MKNIIACTVLFSILSASTVFRAGEKEKTLTVHWNETENTWATMPLDSTQITNHNLSMTSVVKFANRADSYEQYAHRETQSRSKAERALHDSLEKTHAILENIHAENKENKENAELFEMIETTIFGEGYLINGSDASSITFEQKKAKVQEYVKKNQKVDLPKANNDKLIILKKHLWDQISDQTFADLNEQEIEDATKNYLAKLKKAEIIANTLYLFFLNEYWGNVTIENTQVKTQINQFSENFNTLHTLCRKLLSKTEEQLSRDKTITTAITLLEEEEEKNRRLNAVEEKNKNNSPAAIKKINEEVELQKKYYKMQALAYTATIGFVITLIALLLERYDISPREIIGLKA